MTKQDQLKTTLLQELTQHFLLKGITRPNNEQVSNYCSAQLDKHMEETDNDPCIDFLLAMEDIQRPCPM